MLNKIKNRITNFLIFSSLIEVIFFFSFNTLWATFILLFGWFLLKEFILTNRVILKYPVSFLMLFGLSLFHFVFPIPLTLIEFKPVTYNLLMPFETFLHHGLFVSIIVFTHTIYQKITQRSNPLRLILKSTSFYEKPSNTIIWITSIIALLFSFYFYLVYGAWEKYTEKNILITIGQSLTIFLWMPVIIPFYKIRNIEFKLTTKTKYFIILYSLLVVAVAIASNWRTILYSGIIIFISMYLIGTLYGYYRFKNNLSSSKIIGIAISIYIFLGPIMDLGVAMVITRQTRYSTNSSDFLQNTLDIYNDKEQLHKFREIITNNGNSHFSINRWDEDYLDNYFFNRYCNLKISDNCIYYADKIGHSNPKMQDVLVDQMSSYVPSVIANSVGIESKTRKEEYQSSITDNLYSLAIHDTSVKGSAIIGSMPGVGLSIFGYWYLLVIIPIFLLIFMMFDSFAYVANNRVYFSYYFFTLIVIVFNFFNDRHVYNFELRWILRNYVESIILFLLLFTILRKIEKIFLQKNRL